MKRELGPTWSVEDREAGELFAQAWEKHFRAAEEGHPPEPAEAFSRDTTVTQVVNRQGPALMRYPNVVGVKQAAGVTASGHRGGEDLMPKDGRTEECAVVDGDGMTTAEAAGSSLGTSDSGQ